MHREVLDGILIDYSPGTSIRCVRFKVDQPEDSVKIGDCEMFRSARGVAALPDITAIAASSVAGNAAWPQSARPHCDACSAAPIASRTADNYLHLGFAAFQFSEMNSLPVSTV